MSLWRVSGVFGGFMADLFIVGPINFFMVST
jgi:hypothetical protein